MRASGHSSPAHTEPEPRRGCWPREIAARGESEGESRPEAVGPTREDPGTGLASHPGLPLTSPETLGRFLCILASVSHKMQTKTESPLDAPVGIDPVASGGQCWWPGTGSARLPSARHSQERGRLRPILQMCTLRPRTGPHSPKVARRTTPRPRRAALRQPERAFQNPTVPPCDSSRPVPRASPRLPACHFSRPPLAVGGKNKGPCPPSCGAHSTPPARGLRLAPKGTTLLCCSSRPSLLPLPLLAGTVNRPPGPARALRRVWASRRSVT